MPRTVWATRERPVSPGRRDNDQSVHATTSSSVLNLTVWSSTVVAMSRRLTPRGEQRRGELLAYATERFATNGYHPTSVAELVDGLGVGKGVFYWYFESKEDLFLEILRSGERSLRRAQHEAMGDEGDPLTRMELAIRASMEWWAEHRELYVLIEFARTETSFAPGLRKGEKVALEDTRRLVQEAMDSGAIADGNASVVAQAVLGVSSVLARTQLLGRGRPAREVADEVVDFCWHGLVGTSTGQAGARRSA
jgi:AcrR family transcriptional regulator